MSYIMLFLWVICIQEITDTFAGDKKILNVGTFNFWLYLKEETCFFRHRKNPQRVKKKERFLIGQNKTQCVNFCGNPLFQSYVQHKNKQFTFASWILREGRGHETDVLKQKPLMFYLLALF